MIKAKLYLSLSSIIRVKSIFWLLYLYIIKIWNNGIFVAPHKQLEFIILSCWYVVVGKIDYLKYLLVGKMVPHNIYSRIYKYVCFKIEKKIIKKKKKVGPTRGRSNGCLVGWAIWIKCFYMSLVFMHVSWGVNSRGPHPSHLWRQPWMWPHITFSRYILSPFPHSPLLSSFPHILSVQTNSHTPLLICLPNFPHAAIHSCTLRPWLFVATSCFLFACPNPSFLFSLPIKHIIIFLSPKN